MLSGGGARFQTQHLGSRGRQISVSLRPAWPIEFAKILKEGDISFLMFLCFIAFGNGLDVIKLY